MNTVVSDSFKIIVGIVLITISFLLHKHECDNIMRIFGLTLGIILILAGLFGVVVYFATPNTALKVISVILTLIIVAVQIWGLYVLFGDKGVACRYNGSTLWLGLLVTLLVYGIFDILIKTNFDAITAL